MSNFDLTVELYDSVVCRLCGSINREGIYLYDAEHDCDYKSIINRYLPLKIDDDGKLPRTICPGCSIQLEATVQFFDLIIEGQQKLRELWKLQQETKKKIDKERQFLIETLEGDTALITDNTGILGTDAFQDHILIKILPEGNLFSEDHELTLKVEGLDKPKRKRGRPRKEKTEPPPVEEYTEEQTIQETNDTQETIQEDEFDEHGRRKRRRKVPQRFMEAVQGVELERILREEGAIDEQDVEDTEDDDNTDVAKQDENVGVKEITGEIIGHLEGPDGTMTEPIIVTSIGRGGHRKKRPIKFKCDFCGQLFKDRARWIKHKAYHAGMKFHCTYEGCHKKFSNKSNLQMHHKMCGHAGEEIIETLFDETKIKRSKSRLICDQCSQSFISMAFLNKHIADEHGAEEHLNSQEDKQIIHLFEDEREGQATELVKKEVDLEEGEIDLKVLEKLKEEEEDDGSKKMLQCEECERSFNHPSSLMYHRESVHNDGRRFICSKCGKAFTHKQLLQRHQMVHSDSRPYPCAQCGLCFKTKSNLYNHRVVHTGERKFQCDICKHQFAHKTSLTLHLRWHKGHRPFKCTICNKSFTQNGNLHEHLRIHSGAKPYECEYCKKRFTTSSQHKLHVKRHTGERPWKCTFCPKSFLHKDTWKTHERRHKGEKPFECNFCLRGFAEHWSLKKHLRLHTGERPYSCNICNKAFADCSNLTKHRRVHSNNKVDSGIWNIIRSHLTDSIGQQEESSDDIQQIIYVTYQDEDSKTIHLYEDNQMSLSQEDPIVDKSQEISENDLKSDDNNLIEGVDLSGLASGGVLSGPVDVTDEDGNPVQFIPDTRQMGIMGTEEQQAVEVKTPDGISIIVQLPKNGELTEEELLSHINQAVARATQESVPAPVVPKNRYQRSLLLPRVTPVQETVNQDSGDMFTGAHIIRTDNIELTAEDGKPLFVTEFDVESYKKMNEYLTNQT